MRRVFPCASLIVAGLSLGGCAHLGATARDLSVTPELRRDAIARAQVWAPTDVSSKDLRLGPGGPDGFPPHATIHCEYRPVKMGGATPKFTCLIPPDDALKIKYGVHNGEVYAEVAAARLFWALGFGAERMYPVRVVCEGVRPRSGTIRTSPLCSERPVAGTSRPRT